MAQSWHDLLFAHYPIHMEVMRSLIPAELELDTYDGYAWVGVVPFRMSGIRPRFCPSVPWISSFLEFNIRTYVKAKDPDDPRPGVYFFSLDAANPIAVAVARSTFKLAYFNADMSLTEDGRSEVIHYQSKRKHRGASEAEFIGRYGPQGAVVLAQPDTLDHWLTERYCLYTVDRGRVYRGEIHHQPWPLQPAWIEVEKNTMAEAAGIELPATEPLLHFARRVDVVVWGIGEVF